MGSTGYKILGYAVWQGGKWYVRRNYGKFLPSRRVAAIAVGVVAAATVGGVLLSGRGDD